MDWIILVTVALLTIKFLNDSKSESGCAMFAYIIVIALFLYLLFEIGMIGATMVTIWVLAVIAFIALVIKIFKG